jgi:hypothetical protein
MRQEGKRFYFHNLQSKICKTIILPTVLFRYETRFLKLKEDHRLMVFEKGVLRRIFGRRGRKWWENGED